MIFKGTKEKWIALYTQGTRSAKIVAGPGEHTIVEKISGSLRADEEQWKHNANLIAHAPELLQALSDLVQTKKFKEENGKTKVYEAMREQAWKQAFEVLDKAVIT